VGFHVAVPPLRAIAVEVSIAVVLPVANKPKVTVPVGATGDPVTVAVSEAEVPFTDGDVDRFNVQATTVNVGLTPLEDE
jgi:hypothetical protein